MHATPPLDLTDHERAVLRAVASRRPLNWHTSADFRLACIFLRECGLIKRPKGWKRGNEPLRNVPTHLGLKALREGTT